MIGQITRLSSAKLPDLTYVVFSAISLYHIDIIFRYLHMESRTYYILFGLKKYHNPKYIYEMTNILTNTYFIEIPHFYKINKY